MCVGGGGGFLKFLKSSSEIGSTCFRRLYGIPNSKNESEMDKNGGQIKATVSDSKIGGSFLF